MSNLIDHAKREFKLLKEQGSNPQYAMDNSALQEQIKLLQSKKGIHMKIYCCGCKKGVEARLTNGKEVYKHRPDLYQLPFWKCDTCNNFVGCHHKTKTELDL